LTSGDAEDALTVSVNGASDVHSSGQARPNARLEEIRDNLQARIAEATREGWLGEVEGLRVSLAGAKDKLAQIDATLQRQATTTQLGMPSFGQVAGRASTASPAHPSSTLADETVRSTVKPQNPIPPPA
jgi:hypothetical protein